MSEKNKFEESPKESKELPEKLENGSERKETIRFAIREKNILELFRGKAGSLGRIFALTTALLVGGIAVERLPKGEITEGEEKENIEVVEPEKKIDYGALFKAGRLPYWELFEELDKFKNEPWAREALEELTEISPYSLLSNGSRFKDVSWGSNLLKKAGEKDPSSAIAYFEAYKDCEGAEDILRNAMTVLKKRNFQAWEYRVILSAPTTAHLPFAHGAVKEILSKNYDLAVEYFDKYKDRPDADEILREALEHYSIVPGKSWLIFDNLNDYGDKLWVVEFVKKAAETAPVRAVPYISALLNLPGGDEIALRVIEQSIETDAGLVINQYYHFKDRFPQADLILEKAVQIATETDPIPVVYYFDTYRHLPSALAFLEKAAIKTTNQEPWPRAIIASARNISLLPAGEELIEKAAAAEPEEAIRWWKSYAGTPYFLRVFEKAVETHPIEMRRLLTNFEQFDSEKENAEILEKALQSSENPTIAFLKSLAHYKDKGREGFDEVLHENRMAALADLAISENLPLSKISEIAADEARFFEEILRIKKKENYLGQFSIEHEIIKPTALRMTWEINALHDAPDEKRFQSVEKAAPDYLYILMVYGEEELYTSSFNGLFSRMVAKMKREKISGDALLAEVGSQKFRTFIKLTAGFNRLNEFLLTMDENARKNSLERFVCDIDKERDKLKEAVAVADAFSVISDEKILRTLQKTIKEEYARVKRAKNAEDIAIYGLLAGLFGQKVVIDEKWTKEVMEKYKLPDILEVKSADLINPDGTNIQQYFFYNDEDGHASFLSFLKRYRNDSNWEIIEEKNHVTIKSKGGQKVEIYANKPSQEEEGPEDIEKILNKRLVKSIVVVHRGHSYHAWNTIGRIPKIAKIVSLGSCGGYSNVALVLEKAPEAHIISTKGVGTLTVNDPLLKSLNEEIRQGKNVNWPQFWRAEEKRFGARNPDFSNYVPPHKNLGVLFLKAHQKLVSKPQHE